MKKELLEELKSYDKPINLDDEILQKIKETLDEDRIKDDEDVEQEIIDNPWDNSSNFIEVVSKKHGIDGYISRYDLIKILEKSIK